MLWRSNSLRHSLCCKPWLHVKVKESSPKNVWLSRCTYILNKGVRCSKPEVYNLKIVLHSGLGRIDLLLSSCFSPAERLMFYFTRLNGWEWYCWWLKSSNSWDVKNCNDKRYQPEQVGRISAINIVVVYALSISKKTYGYFTIVYLWSGKNKSVYI